LRRFAVTSRIVLLVIVVVVVDDIPGFKTLNSIIISRGATRRIRLNTRRKNVNAIVITLGRSALVMTHNIGFGVCDGEIRAERFYFSARESRAKHSSESTTSRLLDR